MNLPALSPNIQVKLIGTFLFDSRFSDDAVQQEVKESYCKVRHATHDEEKADLCATITECRMKCRMKFAKYKAIKYY